MARMERRRRMGRLKAAALAAEMPPTAGASQPGPQRVAVS